MIGKKFEKTAQVVFEVIKMALDKETNISVYQEKKELDLSGQSYNQENASRLYDITKEMNIDFSIDLIRIFINLKLQFILYSLFFNIANTAVLDTIITTSSIHKTALYLAVEKRNIVIINLLLTNDKIDMETAFNLAVDKRYT